MLAAKRSFEFGGKIYQTPMVVPSFSSRGFDDVSKIISVARDYLTDEVLISAYDLEHSKIRTEGWTFPTLTFVDSGGYEKGAQTDLSDLRKEVHYPKKWDVPMHRKILKSWDFSNPTVIVSYDNPRVRRTLTEQMDRATKLFDNFPDGCPEILLKAEESRKRKPFRSGYLDIKGVGRIAPSLKKFKLIGVTEKELGKSLIERMKAVASIRRSLTRAGLDTPLHVFGGLDPITSSLYFLSGADIFDGLTWLRFAYLNGYAVYRRNFAASELSADIDEASMNTQIHHRNYNELRSIAAAMKRYLTSENFEEFAPHGAIMRECMTLLNTELGDN